MIVIELVDAVEVLFTALMAWIAAISAAATLAGWGLVWVVTRVAKRARRGLRRACGASDGPKAAPDPRDAPEPAEARTVDPGYGEAA
ncbi:hypothetical protein ACPESV_24575 [Streptomyces umbrinus]|uniref:hypothetical protein n=1 Tax=Streptomyces umbrinus TaxID=67370 RepID=UPI003C2E44C3